MELMLVIFIAIAFIMFLDEDKAPVIAPKAPLTPKTTATAYSGSAYCASCKSTVSFNGEVRTSDSGRKLAFGNCSICGGRVNRILRSQSR